MRFAPALAICGLLCGVPLAHANSNLYSGWVKAQTPEVVVVTNLSARAAADIAAEYTVFRQTVFALLAPPGRKLPPAVILVMNSDALFKQAVMTDKDQKNLLSFQTSLGSTQLMAVSYEQHSTTIPFLYEADVTRTLPRMGYTPPLWMAQGTGEVFASCKIGDKLIEIGGLNANADSASAVMRWNQFFDMGQAASHYSGDGFDGSYQRQSWKLMHLVLLPDDGTSMRDRLLALDHAVRFHGESEQTVCDMLSIKPANFDGAVQHHYRYLPTIKRPSHLAEIRAAIHPVALPPVEVQAYCSEIEEIDGNSDQGDLDVDQAILAAPNDPIVNEAMAWRQIRGNDLREAVRYFRKAIEAGGPTQAEDYSFAAEVELKDNGDSPGSGGPGLAPAIDDLHHALALDASNPQIYLTLARAFMAQTRPTQADADALTPGVGDDDGGLRVEYMRALILREAGNLAASEDALHHVADKASGIEVREAAQTELARDRVQADAKAVARLANAGKFDEAIALIDAGMAAVHSEFGDANYRKLRRQVLDLKQVRDLVALYQAKDYETFVAQAQAYVDSHPHERNSDTLREDIEDAQSQVQGADIKSLPEGVLTKSQ